MSSTAKRYGGRNADERVAVRRAQLLDGALELIGAHGWGGCTVRAVCAQARLTPRYFYESFADRDTLLFALFDQIAAQAATAVVDAVAAAPASVLEKARAAIGAFVTLVSEDPRKARVLFVEATGSPALQRRRRETIRLFAGLVAGQARAFYGAPATQDPLVETTAVMLAGGLAETLLAWLDGGLDTTREQLVEDCAQLFVAAGERALVEAQRRIGATKR